MVEAGWSFTWTPAGHFLTVPGVKSFPLQCRPNSTLAYLVVVLVSGTESDPKVTFFDVDDPTHVGRTQHSFLIDTGADHSLLQPGNERLLARQGSFSGVHCTGIAGGAALPILGAGYLDFVFPGQADADLGWAGHVVNVFDTRASKKCLALESKESVVCLVTRDVHRPSAGPPIMSAKQVADRFNIFDHDDLEAFCELHPGVAPFKADRRVDYSYGISQRATGRKAPTRTSLNRITMEISLAHEEGRGVVD